MESPDTGSDQLMPEFFIPSTQSPCAHTLQGLAARALVFRYGPLELSGLRPSGATSQCIPSIGSATLWESDDALEAFGALSQELSPFGYTVYGWGSEPSKERLTRCQQLAPHLALLSSTQDESSRRLLPESAAAALVHNGVILKAFDARLPPDHVAAELRDWVHQHKFLLPFDPTTYSITERRGNFLLSNDKGLIQDERVYEFLRQSHWAEHRPRAQIDRSIVHSDAYGIYELSERRTQVAFARVVTDFATFAYLCDVFVDQAFRGLGLSKWLMEGIMKNPQVSQLRRFVLVTQHAHTLYQKFGFECLGASKSRHFMEILR